MEEDHRIDEQRQEEIHQHTADHDQQTLPGRFGTELPRLFGLFHLFGIEALVDHTGNLTIAAEGQPTHAILRVTALGLKLKQAAVPLPDGGVEEQVELIYAYAEQFGEEEVSALMQQYQQANGQHEL